MTQTRVTPLESIWGERDEATTYTNSRGNNRTIHIPGQIHNGDGHGSARHSDGVEHHIDIATDSQAEIGHTINPVTVRSRTLMDRARGQKWDHPKFHTWVKGTAG